MCLLKLDKTASIYRKAIELMIIREFVIKKYSTQRLNNGFYENSQLNEKCKYWKFRNAAKN